MIDVFPLIFDGWVEAPPPGSLLDSSLPLLSEAPPLWGPWAVSACRPCVCPGRRAARSKPVLKADETTQEEMSKFCSENTPQGLLEGGGGFE